MTKTGIKTKEDLGLVEPLYFNDTSSLSNIFLSTENPILKFLFKSFLNITNIFNYGYIQVHNFLILQKFIL